VWLADKQRETKFPPSSVKIIEPVETKNSHGGNSVENLWANDDDCD
jgi:hypothetical protein